jgi:hypothetical protein
MASDGTIDSEKIILNDLWPGVADPRRGVPTSGFTGATHHNVSEAVGLAAGYRLGDKRQVRNVLLGIPGLSTFIYLKLEAQDANALAARHIVALHTDATPYDVTNDAANDLASQVGPSAIGIGAMTTDNVGWFWCGGVCPEDYVAALGGLYATLNPGTVAIGQMTRADGTASATYGDFVFDVRNAVGEANIGFALAGDDDGA